MVLLLWFWVASRVPIRGRRNLCDGIHLREWQCKLVGCESAECELIFLQRVGSLYREAGTILRTTTAGEGRLRCYSPPSVKRIPARKLAFSAGYPSTSL